MMKLYPPPPSHDMSIEEETSDPAADRAAFYRAIADHYMKHCHLIYYQNIQLIDENRKLRHMLENTHVSDAELPHPAPQPFQLHQVHEELSREPVKESDEHQLRPRRSILKEPSIERGSQKVTIADRNAAPPSSSSNLDDNKSYYSAPDEAESTRAQVDEREEDESYLALTRMHGDDNESWHHRALRKLSLMRKKKQAEKRTRKGY